jgi:hypothetical protein
MPSTSEVSKFRRNKASRFHISGYQDIAGLLLTTDERITGIARIDFFKEPVASESA